MKKDVFALIFVLICLSSVAAGLVASDARQLTSCPELLPGEVRLGSVTHTTIQQAIDAAQSGDVVCVGPGIYRQRIVLGEGVSVIGSGADATVLDGGANGTVVKMASESALIGVTVQNTGIGPFFGTDPDLMEKTIGVLALNCQDVLLADLNITRCKIGVQLVRSSGEVTHCQIFDCCERAGAPQDYEIVGHPLECYNSSFLIENLLSARNDGCDGVTLRGEGSAGMRFRYCTIVSTDWYGIMVRDARPSIANCIVVGGIQTKEGPDQPSVSFTCIWNEYSSRFSVSGEMFVSSGDTGLFADPLFVDSLRGNYQLRSDSPCVDAGDPASTDPDGSRCDIGVYGGPEASKTAALPSQAEQATSSLNDRDGDGVPDGEDFCPDFPGSPEMNGC